MRIMTFVSDIQVVCKPITCFARACTQFYLCFLNYQGTIRRGSNARFDVD